MCACGGGAQESNGERERELLATGRGHADAKLRTNERKHCGNLSILSPRKEIHHLCRLVSAFAERAEPFRRLTRAVRASSGFARPRLPPSSLALADRSSRARARQPVRRHESDGRPVPVPVPAAPPVLVPVPAQVRAHRHRRGRPGPSEARPQMAAGAASSLLLASRDLMTGIP